LTAGASRAHVTAVTALDADEFEWLSLGVSRVCREALYLSVKTFASVRHTARIARAPRTSRTVA
jgi:hypothetical protein